MEMKKVILLGRRNPIERRSDHNTVLLVKWSQECRKHSKTGRGTCIQRHPHKQKLATF